MSYMIGVDTGGTFTDCVVIDEKGHITTAKALSTPGDFSEGVINSLQVAAERLQVQLQDLLASAKSFYHGTTISTNAVLTGKGAKVGLITTQGHKDAIFIMRAIGRGAGLTEQELKHYAATDKPTPIVPKHLVKEVTERVDYKGEVIVPFCEAEARKAVGELLDKGVEAIAVSFLWSFMNPAHEQEVRRLVHEQEPNMMVTLSSEIAPKIGEYERTATTVMNAATGPLLQNYVSNLEQRLKENGLMQPLLIMQSTGGLMSAVSAAKSSVSTLVSGPAGGVVGSQFVGSLSNDENIICTDVGGTSFDVGLVDRGIPVTTQTTFVNQYTLHLPMIDVISIGSGGGSIAWIGPGPSLKVGPQSAGADPGPACYDRGGKAPTVTDADVVLGYINPDNFLGGAKRLRRELAEEAIRRHIAEPLGISVVEAALGIYRIVSSQMADLVRKMSIERGKEPRDFVIYAYGGAGPTHATAYGADLGVKKIVVPLSDTASVYSAFGIATSDIVRAYEWSDPMVAPFSADRVNRNFEQLRKQALDQLLQEGIAEERVLFEHWAEMRFKLQVHQLDVPFPDRLPLTESDLQQLSHLFETRYEEVYGKGTSFSQAGYEIVTQRVIARVPTSKPEIRSVTGNDPIKARALVDKGTRKVYWPESKDYADTKVIDGLALLPGMLIEGPAVIELPDTSIPLFPRQRAQLNSLGNIEIEISL